MANNYNSRLVCSQKTKDTITIDCVEEYVRQYPVLKRTRVTNDQILKEIARHYLKGGF